MIEINGDFWKELETNQYDAICCTTNSTLNKDGHLVMGKGIALDFAKRWPNLPLVWGLKIGLGHHLNGVVIDQDPNSDMYLMALRTKEDWKKNSSIELIEQSAYVIVGLTDIMHFKKILLTRPGCGCGGLNWTDVKPVLDKIFDDRFVVINKE